MFAKRSLKKSTVPLAVGLALGMALPVSASALTLPSPYMVSAGPLGQIGVQGVVSGLGFYQDNPQGTVAGTLASKHVGADISNGLVIVQKSSGLVQFTLEAGAYSFPTLASGFTSASQTVNDFGALPVAYVTLAPSKAFSVEIGKLPTLIGAEDGFTFQNLNIE
ncbi:outer membrane beta-barrel protein, partial [Acidithiobacillus caldus]